VHLFGFVIRIYYDARSSECKIRMRIWYRHILINKPFNEAETYKVCKTQHYNTNTKEG